MAVAFFLAVFFLLLCIPSGGSTALVFSGELIHPDSPESPLYDPTSTPFSRIRAAVQHRSASLANYSNSRLLAAIDRESKYLDGINYYGTYVVKLRIGTPPQTVFVGVSTTAPLSHVLCFPLLKRGKSVLFNPNASTTYSTIPCLSDSCGSLRRFPCDSVKNRICRYQQRYGRFNIASGYLSNETLHFENEDGIVSVPGILLGCTHKIEPSPEDEERNRSIGILALSNNRLSLFNQMHYALVGEMPKKFSYCLPLRRGTTSKIYFGDTPPSRVDNYTTTPLYISAISNLYYLNLKGIVIQNGEKGPVHIIAVKRPQSRHEGNILVDSGTPITFLMDEYMETVIEILRQLVPRKRVGVPKGLDPLIKYCFDWSKPDVDVLPIMEFNFENQANITGLGVFEEVKKGVICLLVASAEFSGGVQVLGSGGQTAHYLEFDIENKDMRITEDFCAPR